MLFDGEQDGERPVVVDACASEGFGNEAGLVKFEGEAEVDDGM